MLFEIEPKHYHKTAALFQRGFEHSLSVQSVLHGESRGRIFVDDPANPNLAFAMTIEGYLLSGNPNSPEHIAKIAEFLRTELFSGKTYLDDNANLTLAVNHPDWEMRLPEMIPTHEIERLDRFRYECERSQVDWRDRLPPGYMIRKADRAMMAEEGIQLHPEVKDWMSVEIAYGSIENFLEIGVGCAVVYENEVVSWCRSDCHHADVIDIGIVTAPEHRRKGLATGLVSATLGHCFERGFRKVGWHCDANNIASWKTAEKVGFKKSHDFHYFFYIYDLADHLAELGWYYFQRGELDKTRRYYEQVFDRRQDNPDYYYHLAAVAWAAVEDQEKTLTYLKEAALHGWHHADYTERQACFDFLRTSPEWKRILEKMRESIEE